MHRPAVLAEDGAGEDFVGPVEGELAVPDPRRKEVVEILGVQLRSVGRHAGRQVERPVDIDVVEDDVFAGLGEGAIAPDSAAISTTRAPYFMPLTISWVMMRAPACPGWRRW